MKRNLLALLVAGAFTVASTLACAQLTTNQINLVVIKASQGDAEAQLIVGIMYVEGQDVPQDYAKAVNWFRKAANQGLADAQTLLGLMNYKGQGVPQNFVEAEKWFRKAADQGNASAQLMLGSIYITGQVVSQDYVQAYKWLTLSKTASKPGSEIYKVASKGIDFFGKKMSPAQITRAQQEALTWASRHSERNLTIDIYRSLQGP